MAPYGGNIHYTGRVIRKKTPEETDCAVASSAFALRFIIIPDKNRMSINFCIQLYIFSIRLFLLYRLTFLLLYFTDHPFFVRHSQQNCAKIRQRQRGGNQIFFRTVSCASFSKPSCRGCREHVPYFRLSAVSRRMSAKAGFLGRTGPWLYVQNALR